jgi:hypothetical protein
MLRSWESKFCMWHYHPVKCMCVCVCVRRQFTNVFICLSIYLHVTNTCRRAPTRDNSSLDSQEFPCTLSDQKTHNSVHKKPRKVPTQSQLNTVQNLSTYFLYIRLSNIFPSTQTFPQFRFSHQTPTRTSLPSVRHEVTSLSSSLCHIFTCLLLFIPFPLQTSSSALPSRTSTYVITSKWGIRHHIHTKQLTCVLQWYNTCQVS